MEECVVWSGNEEDTVVGLEMVIFIWAGICLGSGAIALVIWGLLRLLRDPGQRQTAVGVVALILLLLLIGVLVWGFVRYG